MDVLSMDVTTELTANFTIADDQPKEVVRLLAYVETATILTIALMGLAGNTLMLIAIATSKRLHTSPNIFVANLAVTEGLVAVMLTITPMNILTDSNSWGPTLCSLWGFMALTSVTSSLFSLAAISLNRFYLIAHAYNYGHVFSVRKCLAMSLLIWLTGFLFACPTVTGWSGIKFNPKTNLCSYSRDLSSSYHYCLLGGAFFIPLAICVVSYVKLFLEVKRSKQKIKACTAETHSTRSIDTAHKPSHASSKQKKDMKLTVTLFTIFLVYVTCGGPYAAMNMIDSHGDKFSREAHVFVAWLGFLHCGINPILYGFLNKQYRDAYLIIFGACCLRRCGRHVVNVDVTASVDDTGRTTTLHMT